MASNSKWWMVIKRIDILYGILNKVEASSWKIFQASTMCFSSVSGAPTANRNMYLFDKTCIICAKLPNKYYLKIWIAFLTRNKFNVIKSNVRKCNLELNIQCEKWKLFQLSSQHPIGHGSVCWHNIHCFQEVKV